MSDCIEIANPNDYWANFWGHDYLVTLSEFGPTIMVNAEHEESALDEAIDYAEEQGWEGLFLQDGDIDELIQDAIKDGYEGDGVYAYLQEHLFGGNSGQYLSSLHIHIERMRNGRSFVVEE